MAGSVGKVFSARVVGEGPGKEQRNIGMEFSSVKWNLVPVDYHPNGIITFHSMNRSHFVYPFIHRITGPFQDPKNFRSCVAEACISYGVTPGFRTLALAIPRYRTSDKVLCPSEPQFPAVRVPQ